VAIHGDAMIRQLLSSVHGRRGEAELVAVDSRKISSLFVCLVFLLTAVALYRIRETLAKRVCSSWAGCCLC